MSFNNTKRWESIYHNKTMSCIVANKQQKSTSLWGEISDCKLQIPTLKAWL